MWLLGVMQPSLGSAYDYLSNSFSHGKSSMKTDSHLARTIRPQGDIRIYRNLCCLQALLSPIILLIRWMVFSFTLSVIHATAVIFPENSVISWIFSPKVQQEGNVPQISYLEFLTTAPNPRKFSNLIETVGYLWEINKWTLFISHSSEKRERHAYTE